MDENIPLRDKRILLAGANGLVGRHLLQRLQSCIGPAGSITCLSRRASSAAPRKDTAWLQGDLERSVDLPNTDLVFHCAPIWLLPRHIDAMAKKGLKRLVAFSSTSAITKSDSRFVKDRSLAQRLREGEHAVIEKCQNAGLSYTLFRPTMIYGYGEDQNVTKIARFIKRYKVFFVAGLAKGLRQPVHVDDLVDASTAVIGAEVANNRVYDLSGGEVIKYKEMVARVFHALRIRPHIVSLPIALYRVLLRSLDLVSGKFAYSGGMADRMNEDLDFDYTEAARDFGYSPQKFLLDPQRDLGYLLR